MKHHWLFPRRAVCVGCGTMIGFWTEWLCDDCRRILARNWVGAFDEPTMMGAAAAYVYQSPAGGVVRRLKYSGQAKLADMMAENMCLAYEQIQPTGADIVTSVPMHSMRERERGFNHARLLGQSTAKRLLLPYRETMVRARDTVQQAKLEGEARRKNLKDAFEPIESYQGQRILLVDDVYTTGATARQCAEVLKRAGARSVSFLAYAKSRQ